MKMNLAWDHRHPYLSVSIRMLAGIWLVVLTAILLAYGYWGWAILTAAGAVANLWIGCLVWLRTDRGISTPGHGRR